MQLEKSFLMEKLMYRKLQKVADPKNGTERARTKSQMRLFSQEL